MGVKLCLGLLICFSATIFDVTGRTRGASFAVKLKQCFSGGRCSIGQQRSPQSDVDVDTMTVSKTKGRRFIFDIHPQQELHWGSWYTLIPCIPSCGVGVRTETRTCFYGLLPSFNCVGTPTRVIHCSGPPCTASPTTRNRVKVTTMSTAKPSTTSATKSTASSAKVPVFVWKTIPPPNGK